MKRIAPEWNDILVQCQVKPITAAIWSEVFAACVEVDTFSAGEDDLRAFLGQVLHESDMLEHLEENLNYSAEGLARTWPHRYARRGLDGRPVKPYAPNGLAEQLHRRPEAVANHCYAGRMGNGDEASGDGWRYRGRGLIQCTGRENYMLVESITGLPVVDEPDLLAQPLPALQCAIAWWERAIPDAILGDIERVTRRVNGGVNGLEHRVALTERAGEALG